MRILYIDTSSSYLYTGIVEDDKLIVAIKEEYGQSLSEVALPKIAELFEESKLTPRDIDKIIVVNGPGSFTGIRIGLTIAKIYAWSLSIPITTILSLEAMAISSNKSISHIPMIDARRGYVFSAIYDKDNNELLKPQHITIDKLKKELNKLSDYEIISNDNIEAFDKIESYNPDVVKIVNYFKNKENINPHNVNPEYLKLTEAEESRLWFLK